ncbi:hypothetical protein PENTCL1PPCAC_7384 [Pristionchus entomophagus]|uniref:Uncharacterized protein n=1 Tax=Pristionchus entomophagus TaxID=358040 RepID=A0AAV5SY80_9BILA|nr:hypothetical protein PENTCL1PPCAC_7384 [Pristionchus entomophagus]
MFSYLPIKLIHFDSAYFLPSLVPLSQLNESGADIHPNPKCYDEIRRLFRETNREEMMYVVKSAPLTYGICSIRLSDIKDVLSHIFSQPHIDKYFSFWKNLLEMFPKVGYFTCVCFCVSQ